MGTPVFIDMPRVVEAMATSAEGPSFALDLASGQVSLAFEGAGPELQDELQDETQDETQRWVTIPRREAGALVALVRGFVSGLEDPSLAAEFAVFDPLDVPPRALAHPRLRVAWSAAEREALLAQAVTWLRGLGVEPVYELPPPGAGRPDHSPVGLIEFLCLGTLSADPDGPVRKRFRAASPLAARRVFERVARELARVRGGDPGEALDARSQVLVDGARLLLVDDQVELTVELPRGLRRLLAGGQPGEPSS